MMLAAPAAAVARKTGLALSVVVIYQDSLTREWAGELWNRVAQLVGQESICSQSWKISDLADAREFEGAVEAAAEADVLVISVRDAGEVPVGLEWWVEAWMPKRAGRAGALLALISVPSQPDPHAGQVQAYLETIARRAGLDFMPRERKLPDKRFAPSRLPKTGQTARLRAPLAAVPRSHRAHAHLCW